MAKQIITFFIFVLPVTSLFGSTIEERLKQIPLHDKICMEHFFDFAIKTDQAAHVLCFDNKPVCFTDVVIKYRNKKFIDTLCLKGWYAFKKHEHLFPHQNFIINEKRYESDDLKSVHIFIINKKALTQCLQEFKSLFREIIDQAFSSEWFISQLESGVSITTLIQNNEMLFGILLGYGEESSKAYQDARRADGSIPEWTETYTGIDAPQPPGCKIYPVSFMGNPKSPKTQKLLSDYETELQTIWNEYKKKNDSLLFFLEHLCRERI